MRFSMLSRLLISLTVGWSMWAMSAPLSAAAINYSRDVEPILSEACYSCHGPDAGQRKAQLRLDTHDGALALHKGKAAVAPGDAAHSELVRRILTADPDDHMPPPKSHRVLSAQQIAVLQKWVEQGAPWGKHWSLVKPVRPALPHVKDATWCRNPIDHFVLARLEKEGLRPSPEASREKLIRRVTLDLTGLPPTPQEIDAFLADTSPDAYEKVVDRLLASPRYGERMALPWLDASRYSDTNGYQEDRTRTSWIWRDWVIKALNDDMPFDEFAVDQLAGDLLPNATQSHRIATSFNRNHMLNGEGGAIPEESRNNYVIDRVNTVSTVFLGLTLQCCQCHDHKFDPFTQKDYYSLFAYFNNIPESGTVDAGGNAKPVMNVSSPAQEQEIARLKEVQTAAETELRKGLPAIDAAQARWESAATEEAEPLWSVMRPISAASRAGATMTLLDDGSVLAGGKNPETDVQEVVLRTTLRDIGVLRLEALPHESLPLGGPGRSLDSGNFVLTSIEAQATSLADPIQTTPIAISSAEATYSQPGFPAANALRNDPKTGWAVWKAPDKQHLAAIFTFANSVGFNGGTEIRVRFHYESTANKHHTMGRFRVSLASGAFVPPEVATALAAPADRRTEAQKQKLRDYFRNTQSREYRRMSVAASSARDAINDLEKSLPQVMVMQEMATPRETHVHIRGQYDKAGDRVFPNVPAILPPLPKDAPANRLGLARWIVSPENPLTARVTVNRYWQLFFGIGLVKTSEDFGIQGDRPSHPELLDWLACQFMNPQPLSDSYKGSRPRPWDVKAMQRLIVTSATYRQSSRVSPELLERDPDNRLLARGPRFRLSSFALRDQALAVSGLLVEHVGGPPVKPYQPPGMWEEFSFNTIKYVQDHGDSLYRRSLYTFWRRTVPPPTLFDSPSRQICTVRQSRTNTPLQSLVLMNETAYVECSRMLAQRLLDDPKLADDAQRLTYAFRLCTARKPKPDELGVLTASLNRLRAQYASEPASAIKLLSIGEKPRDKKLNPSELAAYSEACGLILNLDETLTKE